jgi:hypothetical protein
MSGPSWLKLLSLALGATLALAAGERPATAADVGPEPPNETREEAARPADGRGKALAASKAKLQKIGAAVHAFSDTHNRLPDDIRDGKGKPLLSWRVALLPHIGHGKLYRQFKLDQPWDSPHNRRLLARMPAVFASPRVRLAGKGKTVYQVFTGPNAVFGRGNPLKLAGIPDGTSNTILAVESSVAVPWTRPGGIPFDRTRKLPDFGKAYGQKPLAVLFDGSTRELDLKKIRAETLKNAIDPADGNVLGSDW